MNEIIAFALITFIGFLPIFILVSKALFKNSIVNYLIILFLTALSIIVNLVHIAVQLEYSFLYIIIPAIIITLGVIAYILYLKFYVPLSTILYDLKNFASGIFKKERKLSFRGFEFKIIFKLIDKINGNKQNYLKFINNIKNNELSESTVFDDRNDILAKSLIELRNKLNSIKKEEEARKKEEEIRNWKNSGVNKVVDTLRHNNKDLYDLSFEVLSKIISYINANVGGIFMLSQENNEEYIEQVATYAYDRRKFLNKKMEKKEGLLGACVQEKKTIYMTKIPEEYMNITTGLGGGDPRSLLIVPLKIDEEAIGVIELAAFEELEPHEIEFIEDVSENIASMLLNLKRQKESDRLIEKGKQFEEVISQQKEEMKMYFDELQLVQDELENAEKELAEKENEINNLKKKLKQNNTNS